MKNKRYITWEEILEKLREVDNFGAIIYGVPKGGMILTAFLTRAKATYDPAYANTILDDIVDSGKTRDYYTQLYPEKFFVHLYEKSNDWLVFPWERDHPVGEETVQQNIVRMLQFIGEDPNREGLLDTPTRVVKMYKEIFRGYNPELKPQVSIFTNGKDGIVYDQMITDTGAYHSHCEHHMVPFFGQYWFGYIPSENGGIIGLSKVARIIDYHCAKLQIQERLVHDIVEDLWAALSNEMPEPLGMGLIMEGEHLCKVMRGVKKKGVMRTTKLKGVFRDLAVREEFLKIVK